jgi:hypothetical protein
MAVGKGGGGLIAALRTGPQPERGSRTRRRCHRGLAGDSDSPAMSAHPSRSRSVEGGGRPETTLPAALRAHTLRRPGKARSHARCLHRPHRNSATDRRGPRAARPCSREQASGVKPQRRHPGPGDSYPEPVGHAQAAADNAERLGQEARAAPPGPLQSRGHLEAVVAAPAVGPRK